MGQREGSGEELPGCVAPVEGLGVSEPVLLWEAVGLSVRDTEALAVLLPPGLLAVAAAQVVGVREVLLHRVAEAVGEGEREARGVREGLPVEFRLLVARAEGEGRGLGLGLRVPEAHTEPVARAEEGAGERVRDRVVQGVGERVRVRVGLPLGVACTVAPTVTTLEGERLREVVGEALGVMLGEREAVGQAEAAGVAERQGE